MSDKPVKFIDHRTGDTRWITASWEDGQMATRPYEGAAPETEWDGWSVIEIGAISRAALAEFLAESEPE